jgi:hypothetical protein
VQLATQPTAPPADAQRLLLKGKALADGKLVKDYNVKDGDTVNLMIKPGYHWDPSAPLPETTSVPSRSLSQSPELSLLDSKPKLVFQHGRGPSIVLSPSPSHVSLSSENGKPSDIPLILDTSAIPTPSLTTEALSTHHNTIARPEFWENLRAFLVCVLLILFSLSIQS